MLIQPTQQIAYWLIQSEQLDGMTPVGQATGINNSLTVISAEGEQAFLRAALGVTAYKSLPAVGEPVEMGRIYAYNGGLIICRQAHSRTEFAPEDTPALWIVYRENASDVLDWISGERVERGMHRIYGGVEYNCIQAHVTEFAPPSAPALWAVYVNPNNPQPWKQPTGAHDAYAVGDKVTHKGHLWQNTTPANVWEPGVFGWTDLGIYP